METRIKQVCARKNISYKILAEKIGVSKQSITNWTIGIRRLKLDDLILISQALDCEIAELMQVGENYVHLYDENGNWLGIRNK